MIGNVHSNSNIVKCGTFSITYIFPVVKCFFNFFTVWVTGQ